MKSPVAKYHLSLTITLVTLITSLAVAMAVQGAPWATVPVLQLPKFGGIDLAQLAHFALWRLATAQLVHVNQAHMLLNVVCLLLLGFGVEQHLGTLKLGLLWLLAGGAGTAASVMFAVPPFDIGSGASQSVMAFSAVAFLILFYRLSHPSWFGSVVVIVVAISLGLDIHAVGHPKPGHAVGFATGLLLGVIFIRKHSGNSNEKS